MEKEREGRLGVTLASAAAAVRRRRWPAVFIFVAALTAVISVVCFLPDVYRSSATVLVDRQQIPDELVRSTVTSGLEVRLHTISQEILSRSRLEVLVRRFDLYPNLRRSSPMEEVVERMRDDIQIDLKGGATRNERATTVAFTVSYVGRDPQKVALVANTLASFYIEENLKVREQQAAGTAEFLHVQLDNMKRTLEQQEQVVSRFKERHIGELPQQMEANLATLEQLNSQLRLNSDQQIQAAERRAAVQKQLDEAENSMSPGGPRAAAQRVEELRKQLTTLRTRYSDKYPDVVRIQAEIAALEARVQSEPSAETSGAVAASPQVAQLRASLEELDARSRSLQAEAKTLHGAVARYQSRVENVPRTEQEYQRLARDYEATKEQYHSLLMRQGEAEVAESMERRQKGEQFRIIEPAMVSERPTAPNRGQLLLLGTLLAFALAVGAVVVTEQLDTSFHTSEDLRLHARVPVLVSIPRVATPQDRKERRRQIVLTTAAATLGLAAIVGASYLAAGGEHSPLASLILKPGS
jgi:polysaccharide chain length determinant protein (PEP-CTERM system associated)